MNNKLLKEPAGGLLASASKLPGGKPMKHLELRRIRISDGYASYFLDQIDHFMLAQFEADVKAAFKVNCE